jgi:hypothetical protein
MLIYAGEQFLKLLLLVGFGIGTREKWDCRLNRFAGGRVIAAPAGNFGACQRFLR